MSRKMAFTGIFTSIAVVFLYLSTIMPTGKLTLYFLASLPVAITIVELGAGAGIAVYFAASLLNMLITGNITGAVPFVFFFGHYPVFKYFIEKGRKAAVELLLKLTVFNMSIFLWYLFCLLYTSDAADDLLCVDFGGRRILKKKKLTYTILMSTYLTHPYTIHDLHNNITI